METAEVLEAPQIDRIPILKERALRGIDEVCSLRSPTPSAYGIDRARLITEGYRNAAVDPIIVRRAKALANVLNNMTVRIFDQELIVGDQTVSHQAGHNYPEFGRWGSVASETQKVPTQDKEQHQNLALLPEVVANASSVLPGHSIHQIKHLNDGLYNNQHSWISNGEPSWAEIDLGDVYTVSKVGFGSEHSQHHNDRAATKFEILVSTDYHEYSTHNSWQKVYEYQSSPVQKTTEFSFEPVDARWVRIHIYETAGGNARIDEIEIYGDLMAEESSTEVLEESQKEKSLNDDVAEIAAFWEANPRLRATGSLFGHTVPGFEKIMRLGFDGIRAEAQAKLDNLDDTNAEELAKEPFWQAMTIICEAAGNFGKRYAQLARDMAEVEKDLSRKQELLQLADVCEQVPHSPARTFHEALQVLWFGHMMIELEDPPNAHSIGRIDQMLYPYYKRDMEEGILTREQALELMKCFGLKIWKSYDVQDTMLGGMKPDGTDGANDVSLLYLDAVEELDLHLQISARFHNNTDKAFWHRVAEVNSKCRGLPQMFSDETIIPALVKKGIPLEEARDYAIIGCIEVTIPGRCDPRVVNHYTNLAKCLELALNDGVCMLSGQQVGVKTGALTTLTSYEYVLEAYKTQVAYDVRQAVPRMHKAELEQRERFPMPILSVLTDDCIEKGIDITAGGARYNSTGVCGYGMANVGDSLAAIKKLVFEEGRLSLMEIFEAMRTNFEGKESLRQMLLNEAPKYGNDDDYVDSIVVEICRHFCEELEQYRNPRGGKYHAHLFSFVAAVGGGAGTAALPDGRLAREPVANSLAPQQGRDKEGITAMLKSAGKIDQTLAAAGTSLIFDLHPSILSGNNGDGIDKLESLLSTYLSIGGGHVECNIVDENMLRAAQKEPEKYQHLSVRVAGYSAYFVNLAPDMQEHIIQKTKNRM
ncbi:discoidin domain-containing protein [bacterium]|nr:discoidin domain-containing protein [bacterium]